MLVINYFLFKDYIKILVFQKPLLKFDSNNNVASMECLLVKKILTFFYFILKGWALRDWLHYNTKFERWKHVKY